jgi:L-arabinokinase
MGGIADYTGSLVCQATLDRIAGVALQERDDREVQVFSFNFYDEHLPFTLRIPLDALARNTADSLRRDFAEPGRRWAGYIVGCLFMLHEKKRIDLADPRIKGLNLAILSTIPKGVGIGSSAAIEVATMLNLADHFQLRDSSFDAMTVAALCQQAENRIVGAPCGIMDQVACCLGQAGSLLRLQCQPHTLLSPLAIPSGVRFLGINSNVKRSIAAGRYAKSRCAAFMAHRMILEKMRQIGQAAGKTLDGDPMRGYLANLDAADYKKYFRPFLPESIRGGQFLSQFGPTIDSATSVQSDEEYAALGAADHHVLEAGRVRNFAEFLEGVGALGPHERLSYEQAVRRGSLLDKAGHMMYASHLSYTNDAQLGADECDLIVDLVRQREAAGFYGARITGGGCGGTVAVLANQSERADDAIGEVMSEYQQRTGRVPEAFLFSAPGAWETGTILLQP